MLCMQHCGQARDDNFSQQDKAKLHPCARHDEVQEDAEEVAQHLALWAAVYETWTLSLAGIPEEQWEAYRGRCTPVRWCLADIGHDRSGPVPSIKVPPQLSLAGRAAETSLKIVEMAVLDPSNRRWKSAPAHCSGGQGVRHGDADIGRPPQVDLFARWSSPSTCGGQVESY